MQIFDSKRASTRVIVNTIAQYSRSLISIIVALYSTRLVLAALGVHDYGIYSLVAGVVAMLSFISNALVSTTQRFLSYHQGKGDLRVLYKLWGNIIVLHLVFSLVLIGILEAVGPFLFNGFLNIAPERIPSAKVVYQCCIFMVTISFLNAPFLALLISHENIIYSSVIQIIDSFLRLGIAFIITYFGTEKLILYVTLLCGISVFDILSYSIYTFRKYPECVVPRRSHLDKKVIKEMTSYLVWIVYSTGCVVGRTQGCAIVLNKFFGTIVNTAFGIAQQVSGAISFVSSSLLNAINPQIVKAEGSGDRKRMFSLAMTASKFSFFLLSMVVLPLVTFMPQIIRLWLGETPEYVVTFCRVILITSLCDQITLGLGTANGAIGNVRPYSLTVNSLKLLTVPLLLLLLWRKVNIYYAIWIYAVMELVCALCRIPFLHYSGGLNIREYVMTVFKPLTIPFLFFCLSYLIIRIIPINFFLNLILAIPTTCIYLTIFYKIGLTTQEKEITDKILRKVHIIR